MKNLRDKLQTLLNSGNDDSGFPILRSDDEGNRLVGYIGASELEHALSTSHGVVYCGLSLNSIIAIVAEDADLEISFHPTTPYGHGGPMASSVSSIEAGSHLLGSDTSDFSPYMDQVRIVLDTF